MKSQKVVKIALRTIIRFASKRTMKLKGLVKDMEVLILIDNGATYNFIQQAVVDELELTILKGTTLEVTIGDGSNKRGKGLCQRVEVKLPELTIIADYLMVELGRVDVILGMHWLSTTCLVKIHWPTLTMSFKVGDKKVTLRGDPSLIKAEYSLKTFAKTSKEEDKGFLLEFPKFEVEEEHDCDE